MYRGTLGLERLGKTLARPVIANGAKQSSRWQKGIATSPFGLLPMTAEVSSLAATRSIINRLPPRPF
jgi:hypothetical protein